MRNQQSIQVEELILHILDSRNKRLQLSEIPIPKTGDPRIFEYFRSRIEDSAGDASARPARFRSLAGYSASVCLDLLKTGSPGTLTLVDGSQLLAVKLFGILLKNRSIASGDLAVCRYRATEDGATESYLAIFKIDPTEALRPVVKEDAAGHQYVTFDIEADVLPTLGDRVQKCALVRRLDPRPEFDLLLLDRQTRPATGAGVALFFTESFLEAELAFDSRLSTEQLYAGLLDALNKLRDQLTGPQQGRVDRVIQGVMSQDRVNVDSVVKAIPKEARKVFREELSPSRLPDRKFTINQEYVEKVMQWRRFRGDHGLRLDVPAKHYGETGEGKLVEWEAEEPANGPPYTKIVIRTQKWTEKP